MMKENNDGLDSATLLSDEILPIVEGMARVLPVLCVFLKDKVWRFITSLT